MYLSSGVQLYSVLVFDRERRSRTERRRAGGGVSGAGPCIICCLSEIADGLAHEDHRELDRDGFLFSRGPWDQVDQEWIVSLLLEHRLDVGHPVVRGRAWQCRSEMLVWLNCEPL